MTTTILESSTTMASSVAATVNATITRVTDPNGDANSSVTPIFLQTRAAQGIAGVFVWAALFLTCQQVTGNLS